MTEQPFPVSGDRGPDTDPAGPSPVIESPVIEPSGSDGDPDDVQPDVAAVRLRENRLNPPGGRPVPTSGGRHARRDGTPTGRRPRLDYVPRHAVSTPGPSAAPSDALTEQFARPRVEPVDDGPAPPAPAPAPAPSSVPHTNGVALSRPVVPTQPHPPAATETTAETITETTAETITETTAELDDLDDLDDLASAAGSAVEVAPHPAAPDIETDIETATDAPVPGKRVRVVLSERKGVTPRPVRMVVDVQELTQVGETVSTSLIRSQLALALRIGGIAVIALGTLPAIFVVFPVLGRVELFGLRLPWLLLGLLAYPFLLGLGYLHTRGAEQLEQTFIDHVQN